MDERSKTAVTGVTDTRATTLAQLAADQVQMPGHVIPQTEGRVSVAQFASSI